ncbi:probable sugar phosphate/phosphate translocator At1g06470 [Dioscorea cayenensis subsp. rotundata]|uniref:Probable sugar phosphate/phosphate translocator At1g06470 n=1 Tax=Dioscorea cayennensis subsp. rotundata TaxID=55577 RepID=A0AB40CFR7_DIOCR|nr:probable sugar phosphate/phosphate translocator At1g06470 [Dioscorea cayenensis subsp. rotundata]XP_039138670.1 probable sugar phosphate/phosphate translocator At1g06470 [Dioscorea cayenensis subsp. rotundata]
MEVKDPGSVDEGDEAIAVADTGEHSPVLRREPSFSRWCDEEGIVRSLPGSRRNSTADESEDFELPLLRGDAAGSETGVGESEGQRLGGFHQLKVDAAFDVENGMVEKLEALKQSARSSVSVANVIKILFFILVWYTFSTCLTLYNKILLGHHMGNFPAPLLMNTIHFTMQAALSNIIIWFQSKGSDSSKVMSWRDYFIVVVPTSLATALDINLSNASLVSISVTFATMCKSAGPIFLLLFAFAFRLESPSFKLFGIMLVISSGVLLTVSKETEFEFWGFVFVMLAAVMSGFRWCMTQILLQKESYGLKNPIRLMGNVTPLMAAMTLVLSLMVEPWHDLKISHYFNSSWHIIQSSLLMLLGGMLAFFMVLTEYMLVSMTSSVTVTIAGVVKEAVTILVAVLYFHDKFTWLKGLGLLIIMVGVSLFNWYKYLKLKRSHPSEAAERSSTVSNSPGKYVILDELDLVDDR